MSSGQTFEMSNTLGIGEGCLEAEDEADQKYSFQIHFDDGFDQTKLFSLSMSDLFYSHLRAAKISKCPLQNCVVNIRLFNKGMF